MEIKIISDLWRSFASNFEEKNVENPLEKIRSDHSKGIFKKKKSAEIPDTGTGGIVGEIHQLISEESGSVSYRSTEHIKNECLKNYLK